MRYRLIGSRRSEGSIPLGHLDRPLKTKSVPSFETSGNDYSGRAWDVFVALGDLMNQIHSRHGSNAQLIVLMFLALRAVFEEQTKAVSGS